MTTNVTAVKKPRVKSKKAIERSLRAKFLKRSPISLSESLWIGKNKEFLKENGWTNCVFYGYLTPFNKIKIYSSYQDKLNGGGGDYSDCFENFFLFEGEKYLSACGKEVLNELGGTQLIPSGSRQIYNYKVARHENVFTTFQAGLHDHNGANRNWKIPAGQTFGIEIETKFPTLSSKLLFARDIYLNHNKWICERDGSLEDLGGAGNCGLEIISPPLNEKDLVLELRDICELANNYGAYTPDGNKGIYYGVHITTGMADNTLLQVAKFCSIINDIKLRPFWQRVARRDPNAVYNQAKGFYYCRFEDYTAISHDYVDDLASNHYRATFVRGASRNVETRIFASTCDANILSNYIESLSLAKKFAVSNDFSLDSTEIWSMFVQQNASEEFKRSIVW